VIARLLEWAFQELERETREAALVAALRPDAEGRTPAVVVMPSSTDSSTLVTNGAARIVQEMTPTSVAAVLAVQARSENTTGPGLRSRVYPENPRETFDRLATSLEEQGKKEPAAPAPEVPVVRATEEEQRKKAKDLRLMGHPVDYIAKELGVSEARVRKLLKSDHLKPTP
jgi:hypothetical protein